MALGLWALARAIRKQPASGNTVIGAIVVEALLLGTVVFAIVAQASGRMTGDPFVLWGYLLTALLVLPVAVAWAFVDRSPTSAVAMFVCGVTVAVMMWRVVEVAAIA